MTTLKKGDNAPDFSGIDQDGKMHQLSDYTGKKFGVSDPVPTAVRATEKTAFRPPPDFSSRLVRTV